MNSPVRNYEAEIKGMNAESAARSSGSGTPGMGDNLFSGFSLSAIWQRCKAITFKPEQTWPIIQNETETIAQFLKSFIGPLIVASAVASFIAMSVVGVSIPFIGTHRIGILTGLVMQVLSVVNQVAMLFVAGWVAQFLAPKFGGKCDLRNGVKWIGYSMAPAAVLGLFAIFGSSSLLMIASILSLWGIYVCYSGVTVMTGVPSSSRILYMIVTAICAAIAGVILALIFRIVTPSDALLSAPRNLPVQQINLQP